MTGFEECHVELISCELLESILMVVDDPKALLPNDQTLHPRYPSLLALLHHQLRAGQPNSSSQFAQDHLVQFGNA
jgi:hypothetical protein